MPRLSAADLRREIVTLTGPRRRLTDAVAPGLTPAQLAGLLRSAVEGDAYAYLTLAEEMEERSPQYAAVLGTRKRAVLGLPYQMEAASDDARDVELRDAVEAHLIKAPAFTALKGALLDALGKGYAAVEVCWNTQQTPWAPRDASRAQRAYVWRDPRYFVYDRITGRELRLVDAADPWNGIPLPPYRFIVHQPTLKMGLPVRGGLARLAAVAYLCAHYALEDWMSFAEVFGMPLRLGRYGPSATATDIQTLLAAVTGLGSDAAAVLPDSMRVEFQSAGTGAGSGELYDRLVDRLDKLISKAVLGRSDSADATAGKLGGEQYAGDVRRDILEADAAELSATINEQLIRPFLDLNYGPPAAYPVYALTVPDLEDLGGLVDMLAKLVPLGLKVEQSVIRDKWGLPDPAPDAELLGMPTVKQVADTALEDPDDEQQPPLAAPAKAANRALNRVAQAVDADPTAPLVERLGAEAAPLLDALLEPVRRLLEQSADLDEFRQQLLALYPDLDPRAFAALMGQALAVADAAGRWEARP